MKSVAAIILASTLFFNLEAYAEVGFDLGRIQKLDTKSFKESARAALKRRGWKFESESDNSVTGRLDKGGDDVYKAELSFTPPSTILIKFLPGFSHKKDTWLFNLKKDVLDELVK